MTTTQRRMAWGAILVALVLLTSCATLSRAVGVRPDGTVTQPGDPDHPPTDALLYMILGPAGLAVAEIARRGVLAYRDLHANPSRATPRIEKIERRLDRVDPQGADPDRPSAGRIGL